MERNEAFVFFPLSHYRSSKHKEMVVYSTSRDASEFARKPANRPSFGVSQEPTKNVLIAGSRINPLACCIPIPDCGF
jgi:hypothetical protein